MKQLKAKIIENEKIAEGFYGMRLESAYLARNAKPGQFVEVKCSDELEPLLRRPLGVHRISRSGIDLLYEVVGKGTEILAGRKPGEFLDVIGPLGNGFNLERNTHDARNLRANFIRTTILVAGGIGVAPLFALAENLVNSVECIVDSKKIKIYVFIGAKTANHILCTKDFKKIGCNTHVSTEDGSMGSKGLITDVLKSFLSTRNFQRKFHHYPLYTTIYACGPTAMLKTVAKIAADRKIKCQVSLEERMACGVGVCLGCPVKVRTHDEYKMVCKDGPVFEAEEIVW